MNASGSSSNKKQQKKKSSANTTEEEEKEDKKEWPCSVCTFNNPKISLTCEMCGSRNPEIPTGEGVTNPSNGTWDCGTCTIRNSIETSVCQMCGSPNPSAPSDALSAATSSSASANKVVWECPQCFIVNSGSRCNLCQMQGPFATSSSQQEKSDLSMYGGVSVQEIKDLSERASNILLDKLQVCILISN